MFDAQSLLGGLLKSATGSSQMGGKAALGMGALGVAIAAFEHFTQDKGNINSTNNQPITPPISNAPPPPVSTSIPPSAPPTAPAPTAAPPPPPMGSPTAKKNNDGSGNALLLIDAMLAAANADGEIDSNEELKIMQQLKNIGSDQEGFDYIHEHLNNPPSRQQICAKVNNQQLAEQVYMVSLIAIIVDTDEERDYLQQLANCLKLDSQTIQNLNQQFLNTEY